MKSAKKYLGYDEMTKMLMDFKMEYPNLLEIEPAGKSLENRNIWAVIVTNKNSGHHTDKPAIYVDACIHGGEVAGIQVCLYLIEYLTVQYRQNPHIARLLDTRTFYILPCVNPDGAEAYLNTPYDSWGNRRPYPLRKDWAGLERYDVNGDGHILLMRVKDKNGEWKISKKDPRVMLPRKAWEYDGEFYRIYPEGKLVGDDVDINDFKILPREYQLNLNRNFPAGWDIESVQPGGGKYPMSEPETKTIVDFVLAHPNIGTAQSFHTYGGVNLRPFSYQSDDHFNRLDLEAYIQLAEAAKETNGYEMVSIYHGFTKDPSKPRRGTLADWMYSHLGLLPVSTELWSMARMAGVKQVGDHYYPYKESNEEEELMVLKWNDEALNGEGFKNWEIFDHPQLGFVEIGGWLEKFTRKNPPIAYLQQECHKNAMFVIYQADFLPEIEVKKTFVKKMAENIYKISLIMENKGFLPSYITQKAKEIGVGKGIEIVMEKNKHIEILEGKTKKEIGDLEGRIRMDHNFFFGDPSEGIPKKTKKVSWLLKVKKLPLQIYLHVQSEKAGCFKISVPIGEDIADE